MDRFASSEPQVPFPRKQEAVLHQCCILLLSNFKCLILITWAWKTLNEMDDVNVFTKAPNWCWPHQGGTLRTENSQDDSTLHQYQWQVKLLHWKYSRWFNTPPILRKVKSSQPNPTLERNHSPRPLPALMSASWWVETSSPSIHLPHSPLQLHSPHSLFQLLSSTNWQCHIHRFKSQIGKKCNFHTLRNLSGSKPSILTWISKIYLPLKYKHYLKATSYQLRK